MLQQLDEGLEAFLRETVPLGRSEVDVSFEAPDKEWGAGITKPTVNLFLWDIRRSLDEAESGRELVERNGEKYWRQKPPRIDFRYLVTAWTTEVQDEHRLLGSVLTTLLANARLEEEHLPPGLAEVVPPPNIRVARPDGKDFAEFWSAIEGQLKPGLDMIVTATVDPDLLRPAGPPTEEMGTRLVDNQEPERVSERREVAGHVDDPAAVGALVTSPRGRAIVDENGNFLVPADPGDEVMVDLEHPLRGTVDQHGRVEVSPG